MPFLFGEDGSATKVPVKHAFTHVSGGSDPITGTLEANARVQVSQNSGATVGVRRRINFIEGLNVSINVVDDPANEEVDVEITAGAISGSGGGFPLGNATPQPVGNVGAAGVLQSGSRADHSHFHGFLSGGGFHGTATSLSAGFMAAADKSNLDAIVAATASYALAAGLTSLSSTFVATSASWNTASSSFASRITTLSDASSSFAAVSASYVTTSASLASRIDNEASARATADTNIISAASFHSASYLLLSASYLSTSASLVSAIGSETAARIAGDSALAATVATFSATFVQASAAFAAVSSSYVTTSASFQTRITSLENAGPGGSGAPLGSQTPLSASDVAGDVGTRVSSSREDHVHFHGFLVGGGLHATATSLSAGFMSAPDKVRIDAIVAATASYAPASQMALFSATFVAASSAFAAQSASYVVSSASFGSRLSNLENASSSFDTKITTLTAASSAFATVSASYVTTSASLASRVTTLEQAGPSPGGGGGILDVQHFQAESFDDAGLGWFYTVNAPIVDASGTVAALGNGVFARGFSGSFSSSVGGKIRQPRTALTLSCEWFYQAAQAPGTTFNQVAWRLSIRPLGTSGSAIIYDFTSQTNANNTAFAVFSQSVPASTIGFTASLPYQFQLTRLSSSIANNMVQAVNLSELITTWS